MNNESLSWSATYPVLSPATDSQKGLHGDKILLPQSALEQLLAAAPPAQDHPSTASRFSGGLGGAGYGYDHGFPTAEQTQQLPQPLTFRLVNRQNGKLVYAGVREFSAPEGTVLLSPYLLDALGIQREDLLGAESEPSGTADDGRPPPADFSTMPQVSVSAQQLPKGSFVRLRPLESGYDDDWKPLLEREFGRSFTTLTKDAVVSVPGAGGAARRDRYRFLVDRVLPDADGAICVVDTDLEVDMEPMDEAQARETVRKMIETQTGGGEIDIWKAVQGEVAPGGYAEYRLPSWQRDRHHVLVVELSGLGDEEGDGGGLDLFVSPLSARNRSRPRDSEHVFSNFDAPRDGVKAISIASSNVALEGAESILIAVHAYEEPSARATGGGAAPGDGKTMRFTLRARSALQGGSTADSTRPDVGPEKDKALDDEQCTNCRQWIPKRTMVLHENFCRRNNVSCLQCGAVFKKGSREYGAHWHCPKDNASGSSAVSKAKHDDVYHAERHCRCGYAARSLPDLAHHRTTVCPEKLILCRFCHLEVPQEGDPSNPSSIAALKGLTEHELTEGGKTEDCHRCGRRVRLIDMAAHVAIHELDKAQRPAPRLCRNANCGRTAYGVGARGEILRGLPSSDSNGSDSSDSSPLDLCPPCSGLLHAAVYDPDGKALRRRIERRYLMQLMVGCRRPSCSNRWCRQGRANLGLPDAGRSTKDVMPATKELMKGLGPDMGGPLFLCTDEASAGLRAVAEVVAGEGAWDLAWCVAASEAAGGGLAGTREWLENWAARAG